MRLYNGTSSEFPPRSNYSFRGAILKQRETKFTHRHFGKARMPEKKLYGVHGTEARILYDESGDTTVFVADDNDNHDHGENENDDVGGKFKTLTSLLSAFVRAKAVEVKMSLSGLPHFAAGVVVKGFGRGSKELKIPTANLPLETVNLLPPELNTGVYFGWAKVDDGPVYKMVMSLGWNPFYKNKEKSMEIHIIHEFENDFYGSIMKIVMLGYIRAEKDFDSLEGLIKTIHNDIRIAKEELNKPEFEQYKNHSFFK